jgi:FkbM family methyltransferase
LNQPPEASEKQAGVSPTHIALALRPSNKLSFLAVMPISKSTLLSAAKHFFRAVGLEVSFANTAVTEQNVLQPLFRAHDFNFVIDVGANTGQYGVMARRCGYRGPIISFEPLSAAHKELTQRAAPDELWTVAEKTALGAGAARTIINIANNSVSSSLLGMNSRHVAAAPNSAFVGTEEISVIALDDCIERYVGANTGGLLKIDTQGYEMEVLRGAHRTLSGKIDVVQTELSLVELYEGQPLMLSVCNFLERFGFNLRDIIPGFKDPASGRLLQLDGIFAKD